MVNIDTSTQLISDATNENMVTERTTEGARPAIRAKAKDDRIRINLGEPFVCWELV
jgi:hypothetical protein